MKAVQWYLADLLLGETPLLDFNTACSFPEPWVSVPKQTLENVTSDYYGMTLNHTAYAGTYNNQAFGNITVYLKTTRHYLNVKQGRLGHALLKQTDTLHQCQVVLYNVLGYERYLTLGGYQRIHHICGFSLT